MWKNNPHGNTHRKHFLIVNRRKIAVFLQVKNVTIVKLLTRLENFWVENKFDKTALFSVLLLFIMHRYGFSDWEEEVHMEQIAGQLQHSCSLDILFKIHPK